MQRRNWPSTKEQSDVTNDIFRVQHATGMMRENKPPIQHRQLEPKKRISKCRILHGFNKLNSAIIPEQTPISLNDAF